LTINILTYIKLNTAYRIIGVVKTYGVFNDLTGSHKDIIRLQCNAGSTDKSICTNGRTAASIYRTCCRTLLIETGITVFIAGISTARIGIITGRASRNTAPTYTTLITGTPQTVITIRISCALPNAGITCLVT
jgi:hypothetical protein